MLTAGREASLPPRKAVSAGLEPATLWLTATCSTIELRYSKVQNERLELSKTVWKTVMLPITSILLSCGLTSSHTPLALNHKLRSCSGVGENRQRYYYFSHSFASKATFGVEPNFLDYKTSTLPLMFCGQSFGSQNRTDELFLAPAYETGWDCQHPSRSTFFIIHNLSSICNA